MDPQSQPFTPYASSINNDSWRLQTDLVKMQQLQAEHAERILRLERRQDDDARIKSVWGPTSPFPNVLGGHTPQQAPLQQPAVDQFRGFDDEANNMISSLHLDADDEPRRGLGAASRANSVRFDETANTNHFSHSSRASGDFISRTSSALSGLQLGERTLSHKSEGRASSQHSLRSVNSGRANSLNMDSTYGIADSTRSPLDTPGLAPGLLLLGAVPAIIRCWMNTNFKHDALLYAAVCSGSYKSFLDFRLIQKLGFESVIRTGDNGVRNVELPIFFPEAIPLTSSSRSSSPAPHLPSLMVDFRVIESPPDGEDSKALQIFIGSDVLRAHNADILFSSNNITLYDDDRNKLSIPLARPESEAAFNTLYITSGLSQSGLQSSSVPDESAKQLPFLSGLGQDAKAEPSSSVNGMAAAKYRPPGALATESAVTTDAPRPTAAASSATEYDAVRPASRQSIVSRTSSNLLSNSRIDPSAEGPSLSSDTGSTAQQTGNGRTGSNSPALWNTSWRRDGGPSSTASTPTQASGSALDWGAVASRTRDATAFPLRRDTSSGIKVLKPKTTLATSRTVSSAAASPLPTANGAGSSSPAPESKSRFFEEGRRRSGGLGEEAARLGPSLTTTSVPSSVGATAATTPKTKSNPVGGASAFSWLNGGGLASGALQK